MDEVQTLRSARSAIERGDKAAARKLLLQVIRRNPRHETAWLWLSALVDDPARERDCLQRVLAINPQNQVAQRHLQQLGQREAAAEAATTTPEQDDTPSWLARPPEAPPAGDAPTWLVPPDEPTPAGDAPTWLVPPDEPTPADDAPAWLARPSAAAPPAAEQDDEAATSPDEPPADEAPYWLVPRSGAEPSWSGASAGTAGATASADEAALQGPPSPTTLELYGAGFVLPCISPTFYARAARFRLGTALGFFLLFALALSTVQILQTYRSTAALAQQAAASFASGRWPEITISRGRASVRGREPFLYQADNMVVIVDTTGRYSASTLSSGRYRSGILVTGTHVYSLDDGELEAIKLSDLQTVLGDPFILDAAKVEALIESLQIIVFGALLLWNTVVRLIYLGVVAVAVWGISHAFRSALSYGQVLALGVYAVVPAVYGTYLLQRVGVDFCGLSTLILVIAWGVGLFVVGGERQSGMWSVGRSLRAWRALIGLPMLLVLALDAITAWRFGAVASWIVALLTMVGLAFVGLWPLMGEETAAA